MKFIAAVLAAGLVGCAATTYPGGIGLVPAEGTAQSERITEANFTIGEVRTAVVGEPLVRVKDFRQVNTTRPRLKASEVAVVTIGPAQVTVDPRQIYEKRRDVDRNLFAIVGPYALGLDAEGTLNGTALQMNGIDVYAPTAGPVMSAPASLRFVSTDEKGSTVAAEGENYEIIFTGRDAGSIRFQYREYTSDDMARAAFSQDLTYPASASTIRYRNLTIAVDAVGSDSITYRVTERRVPD